MRRFRSVPDKHAIRFYGWSLALLLLAIGGCSKSWDMPEPQSTGVDPLPGTYSFSQQGHFEVRQSMRSGKKYLRFSRDGYRYDDIDIKGGSFSHERGEIGGTDCPTDAYAISGSFTSTTKAAGVIKYGSDCKIKREAEFAAEIYL